MTTDSEFDTTACAIFGHEYIDGYDPADLDTLVKVCDLCGHIKADDTSK